MSNGNLPADSFCAQCFEPIIWAQHAITTNALALNPEPDPKGTIRIVGWTGNYTPRVQGGPSANSITHHHYREHRCPPGNYTGRTPDPVTQPKDTQ